jgi:hypothetical protein
MIRLAIAVLAAALLAPAASQAVAAPPAIKNVFVIVLENENYATTFGKDSPAPYLAKTLVAKGQLLTHYFGIAHFSLPNYIAMVSGQGPNPQTQTDCQFYNDFAPDVIGADEQAMGTGCVFPADVKTVADQLTAKGLTWGGYAEDMANTPTEAQTCRHPEIGMRDGTQSARATDQYAARHNPFVYFHSIIDSPDCAKNDVDLSRLPTTLAAGDTPNYVFITPDLCSDGHDQSCADPKQKGGYAGVEEFLKKWVPQIMASSAYRNGGLLAIIFDESGSGAQSCCVDDAPNSTNPGLTSQGPGGGQTGAVLLSPFIRAGTKNDKPYNHYSLLRSVEDIFGLKPLGYAARSTGFGDDVYNAAAGCFEKPLPKGSGPLRKGTLIKRLKATGRKLTIALAHSAKLKITARIANGPAKSQRKSGKACKTVTARLPARTRSVTVKATAGGRSETRTLAVK